MSVIGWEWGLFAGLVLGPALYRWGYDRGQRVGLAISRTMIGEIVASYRAGIDAADACPEKTQPGHAETHNGNEDRTEPNRASQCPTA